MVEDSQNNENISEMYFCVHVKRNQPIYLIIIRILTISKNHNTQL